MNKALKSLAEISGGFAVLFWVSGLIYAESWSWTRPTHSYPAGGLVYPFNIKDGGLYPSHSPYWFVSATDALWWHLTFIAPLILMGLALACGLAARSFHAEENSN
jgi:hypothetical protein